MNKKNYALRVLTVLLIVLLYWISPQGSPVEAQTPSTILSIQPSSSSVSTCGEIILTVRVENVVDLYGYDVHLTFTPGTIRVLDVENGTFLTSGFVIQKTIDNSAGDIKFSMTQTDPATPKSGNGDLVYIRVQAISPGSSVTLHFGSFTHLANTEPAFIPFTAIDGTITPIACPPTTVGVVPNPATVCTNNDVIIKVRVENVQNLWSFDFSLTFDPSKVQVTALANGGFLTPGLSVPGNGYNNTTGNITYAVVQSNPSLPKTGSGDLISITFHSSETVFSTSTLDILKSSSLLVNSSAGSISYTDTDGVLVTSSCDPNAVEIMSFDVVRKKLKAFLTWETANELNNVGFNIYRSGFVDGTLKKVNKELIPAKVVGSLTGAEYAYIDKLLKPWKTYYYWLESIDLNGETNLTGPIEAAPPKK